MSILSSTVHSHGLRTIKCKKMSITWIPIGNVPNWEKSKPISDERIVKLVSKSTKQMSTSGNIDSFMAIQQRDPNQSLAIAHVEMFSLFKDEIKLSCFTYSNDTV